ncbi:hypothetical protein ACQPZF_14515 [Actinosynnema sp. CS-041913]|uniref:hypothetical protein n=1 Tax=Actinosynnema sp. CS-041913 TaxID=3239917 RepID=UPI003D8DB4DC
MSKIVVGVVAVLVVGGGVAVARYGFGSSSTDAHPPCDQLPSPTEVSAGLTGNKELADEIRAVGGDVSVDVGTPCDGDRNRALIQVTYGSADEREAVQRLLSAGTGFGVPVHLVER